jgi:hypothetical protein
MNDTNERQEKKTMKATTKLASKKPYITGPAPTPRAPTNNPVGWTPPKLTPPPPFLGGGSKPAKPPAKPSKK